jgi:hypothetical protein
LFAGEISDRVRCRDYAPAAPGVKQAKIDTDFQPVPV